MTKVQNPKHIQSNVLVKAKREEIIGQVKSIREKGIEPYCISILSSDHPSAYSYAKSKEKLAIQLGIKYDILNLANDVAQSEIERIVAECSNNPLVHGIVIEFPLPPNINADSVLRVLNPAKDIDGLTSQNLGLLAAGNEIDSLTSATAQACIDLVLTVCPLSGKKVGIIGRGKTVGRPLILMLINRDATITVTHSKTNNLKESIQNCEIIFVAIGKAHFIGFEHLSEGQIVIDAGINIIESKVVGDVDPLVIDRLKALSPVPGGVGPLTSTIIFQNLIKAIHIQIKRSLL